MESIDITLRSSYTQYENYQPSTGSVSSSDESDVDQVMMTSDF